MKKRDNSIVDVAEVFDQDADDKVENRRKNRSQYCRTICASVSGSFIGSILLALFKAGSFPLLLLGLLLLFFATLIFICIY